MNNELVKIVKDRAMCNSRQVAEMFGKEHKSVLRSIDNLILHNDDVKVYFHGTILCGENNNMLSDMSR